MTKPLLPRLIACPLSLLAIGCAMGPTTPEEVEPDQWHTELLAGNWSGYSHTLILGRDSTFEECLDRKLPSDSSSAKPEYCTRGTYAMNTSEPVFRPASCTREDSAVDCGALDLAFGDSMTLGDELLMTLRHKDRGISANVIIDRGCAEWKEDLFGKVCVKLGPPTGSLDLYLGAQGTRLNLRRQATSDDSL